jgi:short-chain Z-isoprenyl diphosphate synthase
MSNPSPSDPKGHRRGADKIIDFLGWCEEAEVKVVTLWMLSTDNFKRTPEELDSLLAVIGDSVDDRVPFLFRTCHTLESEDVSTCSGMC